MTFVEIAAGYRVIVNNEEQDLLNQIGDDTVAYKDLDERQQLIADGMVSNGVLYRKKSGDDFVLIASTINEIPGYR